MMCLFMANAMSRSAAVPRPLTALDSQAPMPLITITSLSDQRLAPYANMRDAELAQRADPSNAAAHGGLFIAEGELVVRRLIHSRFQTVSVLTTPARLQTLGNALDGMSPDIPIYLANQHLMNDIVGFNMHRGVLAIGARGGGLAVADLLTRRGPLILLEDVNNNDNLGGIFRNAAALGGPGCAVVLSPACADPFYRKSLRVSMGSVLGVPFARSVDWRQDLHTIRQSGFRLWGLTPRPSAQDITGLVREPAPQSSRVAILLGAEGPGLTEESLNICDNRVRIPMRPGPEVDSLNVGVASAIALYCLGTASTP